MLHIFCYKDIDQLKIKLKKKKQFEDDLINIIIACIRFVQNSQIQKLEISKFSKKVL